VRSQLNARSLGAPVLEPFVTFSTRSGLVTARRLSVLPVIAAVCGPHHVSSAKDRTDCPVSWSVAAMQADTISSAEGKIAGRIIDTRTAAPVEGARVRLTSAAGAHDSVVASKGGFAFAPLVAGTYEVQITRIGYHPRRDTLRLQSAETMNVTLSIDQAPNDECHGLELVTRKPWWKFW
jgi:carboxypeptidase family protein